MAAISLLNPQNPTFRAFIQRLGRSRFLWVSVTLHVVLVLTAGGVVLVRQAAKVEDVMDSTDAGLVQNASPQQAPEQVQQLEQQTDPTTPTQTNVTPVTSMAPLSVATETGRSRSARPRRPMCSPATRRSF